MTMPVIYPLFVFERDDKSMRLIEDHGRILFHLEATDIENDEYFFWDSSGDGVNVSVMKGNVSANPCAEIFPLRDAFAAYADANGLRELNLSGAPIEVWRRIQEALKGHPKKRGFFSRLFSE